MKRFIKVLMLVCIMACMFTLSAYADEYYVTNQSDFENILATATDGSTINLAAGEYKMVSCERGITLTIKGAGQSSTAIQFKEIGYHVYNGTINFADLTIKSSNNDYQGLDVNHTASYTNVTFSGQFWNYAANVSFTGCTFNQSSSGSYNIWTYAAESGSFSGCTFNSAGKAMLVYSDQGINPNISIDNCTFNASGPVDGKAAIEIDSRFGTYNVAISGNTTATGFDEGSVSGNTLWNNKQGTQTTVIENIAPPPDAPAPNPDPGQGGEPASNPYAIPATADNSNMTLWSLLFVAFAAVAVITAKKRKA